MCQNSSGMLWDCKGNQAVTIMKQQESGEVKHHHYKLSIRTMKLIILLKYSKQVICIQTYGVKVERQEEMVKEKKKM